MKTNGDRAENLTRRAALAAGGGIAGAALVGAEAASAARPRRLDVDVAIDLMTFDAIRPEEPQAKTPTGPYYVRGTVFRAGGVGADGKPKPGQNPIGIFHSMGWLVDGQQGLGMSIGDLNMSDGDLQFLGSFDARVSVLGGAGRYKGAAGAGTLELLNLDTGSFRARFRFVEL